MQHKELLNHLAEILEVPAGSLTGKERLAEMEEWNSMAIVSFIAFADEQFQKTLSPRQFTTCETLDDLGRLVGVAP